MCSASQQGPGRQHGWSSPRSLETQRCWPETAVVGTLRPLHCPGEQWGWDWRPKPQLAPCARVRTAARRQPQATTGPTQPQDVTGLASASQADTGLVPGSWAGTGFAPGSPRPTGLGPMQPPAAPGRDRARPCLPGHAPARPRLPSTSSLWAAGTQHQPGSAHLGPRLPTCSSGPEPHLGGAPAGAANQRPAAGGACALAGPLLPGPALTPRRRAGRRAR